MTDILPAFRQCLREHLVVPEGEEIELSTELRELGLDSMSAISLLLELEKTFSITFPDRMLAQEVFRTGTSLLETVQELLAQRSGG